ncbi:MAG: hypothetical protein ACRBBW_10200 [Cellvibrionaceae bacterium]
MSELLLALDQFHFLRPYWLLALPLGFLISWLLRKYDQKSDWQKYIAPALLDALLTRPDTQSRATPALVVSLLTICWVIALAGPSWQRLPSPLVDDTAPLVIGLYLGESMLEEDLKPSRLTHAKQKIANLLESRRGAPTSLMIYAGSTHTVLPLTEDGKVLALYLEDLDPRVVPKTGNRPDLLLQKASLMLGEFGGSIVLVGDDLIDFLPVDSQWNRTPDHVSVSFLSVQTPMLDKSNSLSRTLDSVGIDGVLWTSDSSDVETLIGNIQRRWQHQLQQRDDVQWRDDGHYFVWPLMILMALFYRRGMVLQWS